MTTYGEVHRRFLQSFVYHPVQTEAEALEVYRHVCQEQGQEVGSLERLIESVNSTVRRYSTFEIKTGLCELTGGKFYVVANTADFKWTKTTIRYNKNEQLLFKKIVDDLVRSENGSISTIACLNAYTNETHTNMSKSDMSSCIAKFVADKWFAEKKGVLYMGVRGAVELEPYVLQVYEDMRTYCPLCKKLIFWGHQCGSCSAVSHLHCLRKFFASTGVPPACPASECNARWHKWDEDYANDLSDESN